LKLENSRSTAVRRIELPYNIAVNEVLRTWEGKSPTIPLGGYLE